MAEIGCQRPAQVLKSQLSCRFGDLFQTDTSMPLNSVGSDFFITVATRTGITNCAPCNTRFRSTQNSFVSNQQLVKESALPLFLQQKNAADWVFQTKQKRSKAQKMRGKQVHSNARSHLLLCAGLQVKASFGMKTPALLRKNTGHIASEHK